MLIFPKFLFILFYSTFWIRPNGSLNQNLCKFQQNVPLKTLILRLLNWLKFHLMKLWCFRPSRSKNDICVSLGFPLFKSADFIEFWYSKWKWLQFSHNVLILGLFRRAKLYGLPHVTVFISGFEIDTREFSVCSLTCPTIFTQFGSV